jgi:MinD-like ATPase involved in chromosome partitioning or flagellar assembly
MPTQKRQPPADVDIPTMGWPKLKYKMLSAAGRPDIVPQLSPKEERQIQRERAENYLMELSDKVPSLTTCFINAKGGAATTTTMAHVASVMAEVLRATVVGTDFNMASGTSGVRLGRDYDQTVTLRELLAVVDKSDETFKSFISRIRPTRFGVRVISSDSIIKGERNRLSGAGAAKLLDAVGRNSEYHLIDTANDITSTVTEEVVKACDILVFTANVRIKDSLRQLAISEETLREWGFQDKVDNSVVVISNIPHGKDLDDYRRYINLHDYKDNLVREIPFKGQTLGVPHDPYIALDREVNLEELEWHTAQAYLAIAIAIFEQVRLKH